MTKTKMDEKLHETKLSLKKAEMSPSARKLKSSNPFIIYDYYNLLEKKLR